MIKAADLFVKCLEEEGVQYIFGIPGEENIDLLEALRTSSITLIVTRHEQAATFMAATYGRLTGRAGVVLSTLGPGATNLVTGIAYAQLGGMPLIAITGQKPIKKSKQGQFQIIDVVQMMKPLTKDARLVTSGENIPSLVRNAFKLAEAERPGVVHLELPEDIAVEMVDAEPIPRTKVRRPGPDPKTLQEVAALLSAARRPLLLVAAGANRTLVHKRLAEFIEKTKIPFFSTQMGKGVIDERSQQYLGTASLSQNDYVHCAFDACDLIVVIGHDIYEKPPVFLGDGKKKVIHMNYYPAQVDRVYAPDLEVVGDIAHTVWALGEIVKPESHWDFAPFMRAKRALHTHIHRSDGSTLFPIHPEKFVSDLRRVMPEDGILTLDNGMYKLWISRNYPAYFPNTLLLDNTLATMGAGLPAAVAAKLLHNKRAVVSVCGDGGFMMNSQDLETAVRLNLHIIIIILKDDGYGMIKWKQDAQKLPSFGLDFTNPDFVKYAEAYGAKGHRVERTQDFVPLMERLLETPAVHLVELPIDYSFNVKVFTNELTQELCKTL